MDKKKPNIVFIMADQLAAAFLGVYGSGVDSSPVLDRLANQGMRFNRSYAHIPLCAPNRATILTGRSCGVHGVTHNNLVLKTDVPTYAGVFRHHGYRTGGFGKFHLTPMSEPVPENMSYLGFDESAVSEDSKLGPWLDWVKENHPEHYKTALAVSWDMPYLKEYGAKKENLYPEWKKLHEEIVAPLTRQNEWHLFYSSPLAREVHQTTYITELGIDFIDRHLEAHSDQPFLCHVSYVDPHDPYDPPAPYDTMFKPEDMADPIPGQWEKDGSQILDRTVDFLGFRKIAKNAEAIKKMRAMYHGSIKFMDDQIGRLVQYLEDKHILDQTILVFTTDHGDLMGDHGLITKGEKHYDKSVRCPLIVYGSQIQQGVSDRLISSVDIFPSLCELAGVETTIPLEGKSFAKDCFGQPNRDQWDSVTIQFNENETRGDYVASVVTDDGWRLTVFNEPGKGEMFNLFDDPDEQNNLFYSPDWMEKKCELYHRYARAYMRSDGIQQYRNLPEVNGIKCEVDVFRMKPVGF